QADYSMGRITQGCEVVEVGDILVPYTRIDFPALPSKRPFSGTMTASGQIPGNVIMTKEALLNSGSAFGTQNVVPSAGGSLKSMERGITGEGGVVYLD